LKLAHVAGPVVLSQATLRVGGQLGDRPAKSRRVHAHEIAEQRWQIVTALAQRRDLDLNDRDPRKEIVAKDPVADRVRQAAVGDRDQPNVGRDRQRRPDALHHPCVNKAMQTPLEAPAQITHVVQRDRAVVGVFKPTA